MPLWVSGKCLPRRAVALEVLSCAERLYWEVARGSLDLFGLALCLLRV